MTLAVLLLLLVAAWFMPQGRDRSAVIHRYCIAVMLAGAVLMVSQQDYWPLALWSLVCINALRRPWPARHLTKLGSAVALYAVYAVSRPHVTPELVPYALMSVVTCGLLGVALWTWEFKTQPNWNHSDMLLVMACACALALMRLHSPLWILALLPLGLMPGKGQALAWQLVSVLAVVALAFESPFVGLGLGVAVIGGAGFAAHRMKLHHKAFGPDHGRVRIWYILLKGGWWKGTWKEKLFGLGWDSWHGWADSFNRLAAQKSGQPEDKVSVWTHPHNEYIHMLFEHGILGLVLLLGWIGSLFVHAWQATPALIIPGVTLCAIAATCFPWSLPTEHPIEHKQYIDYRPWGNMGMVILSLLMLCLMRAA
jgi:O-antigen ligase